MSGGQTLASAILSQKAGASLRPGDYAMFRVDVALGNDITAPVAIAEFEKAGGVRVFDPEQLVLVCDHFTPCKDIASAELSARVRRFARQQGIRRYFDVGRMGIEHVLLPEEGLVKPGDLVVGADSHTCTYGALGAFATGVGSCDLAGVYLTGQAWLRVPESIRVVLSGHFGDDAGGKDLILHLIGRLGVDGANYRALEFSGPGLAALSMDGRFTVANMAVEAGAKAGLFPVDETTRAYCREAGTSAPTLAADVEAAYLSEVTVDLSRLHPQVAYPDLPSRTHDIGQVEAERIRIDQVVIGSCSNGRLEDLREAARVLRGRRVHPDVRCIVIPGSQRVYRRALAEGLLETFIDAGCAVSTPTCGPCLGGHMGILAAGERAIATTNRNFTGRMGSPQSEVYLAGPAVAAATAVAGVIVHPRNA